MNSKKEDLIDLSDNIRHTNIHIIEEEEKKADNYLKK